MAAHNNVHHCVLLALRWTRHLASMPHIPHDKHTAIATAYPDLPEALDIVAD